MERIAETDKIVKLMLVGKLGWKYKSTIKYIENSKCKDRIVRLGYISNEEKTSCLRNLLLLFFRHFIRVLAYQLSKHTIVGLS